MDGDAVRERAGSLPRQPGVYRFLDGPEATDPTVLYVGKAVDLRDRVRSYADPRGERIRQMVARAAVIDVVVTDTETQALLLEANLIKRHQPRYNVRLKDDKSYPLVQLTDHDVPRIEITRDPDEGATVFGPFTDKGDLETVVKALRETYGLRGCSDHKYANRERPCLDYDIGLCSAPCTGEISATAYAEDVTAAERFFRGETGVLADPIRREMEQAAADAAFERAANRRDRLDVVESFHGGHGEAVAGDATERSVDVLGVALAGTDATVARLHSEGGQLVERDRHTLAAPEGEHRAGAVLAAFVTQYYADRGLPDALLVSDRPTDADVREWLEAQGVTVRVPGAGREATLVDLALKNARRHAPANDETAALARALDIPAATRIEGFDVSHTQGTAVVGSDVAFVDGTPAKREYRRKRLEDENDDYANMRRLLAWRGRRAREGRDDRPDPDLLVVDGGQGQLAAAREALAETGWDVPVVALAKADERVVTPERTYEWPDDAPHRHLLQRVRDEAHRFAVQYHQTIRDEVTTALDDVTGIGPKTRAQLLGRFGSVDAIRSASAAELRSVEGVGSTTVERIERQL